MAYERMVIWMNLTEKLKRIANESGKSYWASRISAELEYAARLSAVMGGKFDRDIETSVDTLLASMNGDGVITDSAASFSEKLLLPLSSECKKNTVICVSHAHIDMNWMWGFHETASLTADTFRTVLDLMYEYPDFTFAQSQASVYKIIEEYAPWLLERIKLRVKEGRWDVTASTWVEADKNMPSGESLSRHILNTKNYLSKLLDIDKESLSIDFEPDTFGHSANVPEICNAGGVKYYYHCRGNAEHCVYKWRSPSGAELLVYRDPEWYNGETHPRMALIVPEFCKRYGIPSMLKVYGVGDHGGGPSRRDIERVIDMASWPIQPTIKFGTFHEFFAELEQHADKLPVVTGEQNFLFTGCYTSQSRIKMSNRVAEARLFDTEQLAAISKAVGGQDLSGLMTRAWQGILFNHFHDILPGSGTVETREYALGEFQRSLAGVNTGITYAMSNIADYIDTSSIQPDGDAQSTSEGAGVGYTTDQVSHFSFPKTERGSGKTRIFTLFNTLPAERRGPVELTVWDWPGDPSLLRVKRAGGGDCAVQLLEKGRHFWGHNYHKLIIDAVVPPLGYDVYVLYEGEAELPRFDPHASDRLDYISDAPIVLDNGVVRAEFDRLTMKLISFKDAATGTELVPKNAPSCRFNYILEDTVNGMSAWRVGNYTKVTDLNETCAVRVENVSLGSLLSSVRYTMKYERSSFEVTVKLAAHSSTLEFEVKADWHEIGTRSFTPQLSFEAPFAYACDGYLNDIPMGTVKRAPAAFDVPCTSFSAPLNKNEGKASLLLTSDTKYGFRNGRNSVAVTLIRASSDPDPYPEYGVHNIRIGLAAVSGTSVGALIKVASEFTHPVLYTSTRSHLGKLPLSSSFLTLEGRDIAISAVKTPEDGEDGIIVRVYNSGYEPETAKLSFFRRPKSVYLTDTNESRGTPLMMTGNGVEFSLKALEVATLRIAL